MSKPRTIWVPRIRMQRSPTSEELASLMVTLDQGLHQVGPRIEGLLSLLEFHTGQRRSVLAIIMVTLLCIYMITGKRAPLACNIMVYLVAAYCSFHNIENSSKADDSRWIVFWMIFGLFNIADYFTNEIREYFPIFWLFKLLFLTWCLAPTANNGVATIYFHLLYPAFLGIDDSADFCGCRAVCNQLFSSCYAWSAQDQPAITGPGARKAEDSGEPAQPAIDEYQGQAAAKAGRSAGVSTRPAGDGTNKRSKSGSIPAGAPTQGNLRKPGAAAKGGKGHPEDDGSPHLPMDAPPKYASDSVLKSRTGTLDTNEHTYESHVSQPHQGPKSESSRKAKAEAAASSWNDISFVSRGDRNDVQRRSSSTSAHSGGKDNSIPVIQPVVQPLFSLYSSPYSSAPGSSYQASCSAHPSTGPYAFGPSYPSYHTRPFYPGCLPQPPFGYSRPRSLLYSGSMHRHKSHAARRWGSFEESELDSFGDKHKSAEKGASDDHEDNKDTQKDAKGASDKEQKKASGEAKNEDKKKAEGEEKAKEGKNKDGGGSKAKKS